MNELESFWEVVDLKPIFSLSLALPTNNGGNTPFQAQTQASDIGKIWTANLMGPKKQVQWIWPSEVSPEVG
jgi:hypothetical protein